jgi:hypothetical protein
MRGGSPRGRHARVTDPSQGRALLQAYLLVAPPASALAPTRYGRQFARRIAVQNFVWIGAPFRWISPRKLTSTS